MVQRAPRRSGIGDATIGVVLAGVTVGSIFGLAAAAALLSRLGSRRAIPAMLWSIALGIASIGSGAGVAHSVPVTALGFVLVGTSRVVGATETRM